MTMMDLHNNVDHVIAVTPQTIVNSGSPENLVSGDIDLQGFNSAEIVAFLGDIDELGGSPVGTAQLEVILEHADDDGTGSPGTYAAVALADVIGPSSVTSGIVATTTTDAKIRITDSSFLNDGQIRRNRTRISPNSNLFS